MDKAPIIVFLVGVVLVIVTSILSWGVVPGIIEGKIKEEVRLINGSETWKKWQKIPAPIYLKFYIFHVTNPDEVERGEIPILEEKGPYVYRESRVKYDIRVFPDEDLISYRQNITYFFEANSSAGCDTDTFNVVNLPFVSVAYIANNMLGTGITSIVTKLLQLASRGGESLVKRNVVLKEFIFDGFDISLYSKPLRVILKLFPWLKIDIPKEFNLQDDKFGVYLGKNFTDEGVFKIYSGVKNSSNFGEIYSIDGKHVLNYWVVNSGNTCNQINGSDGTIFPPFIEKDTIVRVFNADICRSVHSIFEKEVEFEGVPGYRFIAPLEILEDPRTNEENMCYCPESGGNSSYCLPTGAVRMGSCRSGAPIVITLPHFLDGDAWLGSNSIGLKPDKAKHETHLDIEPNTGLPLKAFKRIQINAEIKNLPTVPGFETARDMIFPAIWVEEYAYLDDDNVEEIKSRFLRPMKIFTIAKWTLIGLGAAIVGISVLLFIVRRRRRQASM